MSTAANARLDGTKLIFGQDGKWGPSEDVLAGPPACPMGTAETPGGDGAADTSPLAVPARDRADELIQAISALPGMAAEVIGMYERGLREAGVPRSASTPEVWLKAVASEPELAERVLRLQESKLAEANAAMAWHVKTIHEYSEQTERQRRRANRLLGHLHEIKALPPERLDETYMIVDRALEEGSS